MIVKFKTVYQPKEGKKFGQVVVDANTKYMFMPGPVELKPNVDYDVVLKRTKWGESEVVIIASVNGKPFETQSKSGGGGGFGGGKGDSKIDFAGRVCAAAIIAGKISSMEDLGKWARGAHKLAGELK